MNLRLGAKQIELSRIDLSLSLNSVPALSLFLKEERDAQIVKATVGTGEKATLSWQGGTLDVAPYAFVAAARGDNEGASLLQALLIDEALESWLTARPDAAAGLAHGIMQNQSELGGWTFLYGCLGHNMLVPANAYKERIDAVLPLGACLVRPIRQDNQQYLETVVGLLQHHLPELVGWCAIYDSPEPLRLIFFDEENAFALDETWENVSANLPVRFVGELHRASLRKTGQQVRQGSKMALLTELAKHGLQVPLAGFLEQGSEVDLLYLPGPVKLGEKILLCETVTYTFEADIDALTTTLELVSGGGTPASTAVTCQLEGTFTAWDANDDQEQRVFLRPPDGDVWQMMDANDASLTDPDRELLAEFVLPTTPSDSFAGLYVKRVEGEKVVFKAQPFATPSIFGSFQKLTLQLEAASISLNTKLLALSTSTRKEDIDRAHGVVANAQMMMNRASSEVRAEAEAVTLVQNVNVERDSLVVGSKTTVTNNVKVDKLKVTGMPGAMVANAQAKALADAAKSGAPFCEECAA